MVTVCVSVSLFVWLPGGGRVANVCISVYAWLNRSIFVWVCLCVECASVPVCKSLSMRVLPGGRVVSVCLCMSVSVCACVCLFLCVYACDYLVEQWCVCVSLSGCACAHVFTW